MGVPGLWDLLRPAAARTSLSTLSREAFYANKNGLRALTVGIDASIWIFHAQLPQYGDNPFLRTIFYKITALLQHPVLPVFVFDGPNKPSQKRNQNVAGQFGTADHRSKQFKALLNACGLEWWNAPGEAEAELAVMSRQGKIDAVLSDDVDALLFGATCLLRNNSPTLSGAQASTQTNSARGDARTYEVYRSEAIRELWTAKEGTTLETEEDCRMAMVLIALLGGGDYVPEGLSTIGPTISFGLANAGLSDFLKQYTRDRSVFDSSLAEVHNRIIEELRTNASKQIGKKYTGRASKIAQISPSSLFPDFSLDAYLNPCTSPSYDPTQGWPGFGKGEAGSRRGKARNDGRGDMEGLAKACEDYFEWGTKDLVSRKFASEAVGVFGAQLVEEALAAVRRRTPRAEPVTVHQNVGISHASSPSRITSFFQSATHFLSSPKSSQASQYPTSQPLAQSSNTNSTPEHVLRIHSIRSDPTNPDLREYRISYKHEGYTQRVHDAMLGTRVDPKDLSVIEKQRMGLVDRERSDERVEEGGSEEAAQPKVQEKTEIRTWMAEYLVREAWPDLVKTYEVEQAAKLIKTPKKKAGTTAKGKKDKGKKSLEANGEDVGAFEAFFTQRPTRLSRSPSRTTTTSEFEALSEARSVPSVPSSPPLSPAARRGAEIVDLSMSSPPLSPSSPRSFRKSPSMPTLKGYPGKKPRSRPCPTSSLSSIPSSDTSNPSTPSRPRSSRSPRSPSASREGRTRSTASPSPTPKARPPAKSRRKSATPSPPPASASAARLPKFANRKFTKSISSPLPSTFTSSQTQSVPARSRSRNMNKVGIKDQPIDLCSSSEEEIVRSPPKPKQSKTPKPTTRRATTSPRAVLESSSRPNTHTLSPAPIPSSSARTASTKARSSTTKKGAKPSVASKNTQTQTQTRLNLPVVASQSSQTPSSTRKSPSPKKRRPKYVVLSSTEDEEMIDLTR